MASKPPFYLKISARYPQVIAAVESLGETLRGAGPLDQKTLHLVQLAAAAAVHSEGAVHSHARRALSNGASGEEVRHALLSLTSTIGFPNVTAALSWAEDVLDQTDTLKD
jgi:4-carboxymuconolactone decarboxylase